MFDIGFAELIIIFIVGLFVIGPERLPSTVRTLALWIGRIRRSLSEVRQEIEQQIGAEDIRRELHNEQVLRNLERMKDTHKDLEQKIHQWASGEPTEDSATPQNSATPGPDTTDPHALPEAEASKLSPKASEKPKDPSPDNSTK